MSHALEENPFWIFSTCANIQTVFKWFYSYHSLVVLSTWFQRNFSFCSGQQLFHRLLSAKLVMGNSYYHIQISETLQKRWGWGRRLKELENEEVVYEKFKPSRREVSTMNTFAVDIILYAVTVLF